MDNAHQEHAKVFKALCDPKRLAILSSFGAARSALAF